jgi:hypothetical protein
MEASVYNVKRVSTNQSWDLTRASIAKQTQWQRLAVSFVPAMLATRCRHLLRVPLARKALTSHHGAQNLAQNVPQASPRKAQERPARHACAMLATLEMALASPASQAATSLRWDPHPAQFVKV